MRTYKTSQVSTAELCHARRALRPRRNPLILAIIVWVLLFATLVTVSTSALYYLRGSITSRFRITALMLSCLRLIYNLTIINPRLDTSSLPKITRSASHRLSTVNRTVAPPFPLYHITKENAYFAFPFLGLSGTRNILTIW